MTNKRYQTLKAGTIWIIYPKQPKERNKLDFCLKKILSLIFKNYIRLN